MSTGVVGVYLAGLVVLQATLETKVPMKEDASSGAEDPAAMKVAPGDIRVNAFRLGSA